jgi:hypothetical protein
MPALPGGGSAAKRFELRLSLSFQVPLFLLIRSPASSFFFRSRPQR